MSIVYLSAVSLEDCCSRNTRGGTTCTRLKIAPPTIQNGFVICVSASKTMHSWRSKSDPSSLKKKCNELLEIAAPGEAVNILTFLGSIPDFSLLMILWGSPLWSTGRSTVHLDVFHRRNTDVRTGFSCEDGQEAYIFGPSIYRLPLISSVSPLDPNIVTVWALSVVALRKGEQIGSKGTPQRECSDKHRIRFSRTFVSRL